MSEFLQGSLTPGTFSDIRALRGDERMSCFHCLSVINSHQVVLESVHTYHYYAFVCVCLCVCVSAPNATKSAENKINLPDIEGTREGRLSIFSHGEPRFTFCPDQFSSHPSLSTLPILTTLLPPNHWVAYVANCLYYVSMSSHANQRSLLEEKHV